MAWLLEDAVENGWAGNGFQTWTPSAPVAAGKLMLVALCYANDSSGTMVVTPPASGGWTQRGTRFVLGDSETLEMWSKIAGASEPSSYTWTHNTTPFPTMAIGVVVSGNVASPFEVVTNWVNIHTGGLGPFTAASINTLSDAALNLLFVSDALRGPNYTCDSGYVEAIDNHGAWYSKEIPTAGPTGTKNLTIPAGFGCIVFQFSLEGTGAPPPPPVVALASSLDHRLNTRPALFAPGGTGRR